MNNEPRTAPMPEPAERIGGSGPGSWAGSGAHLPGTRAEPAPATVIAVPTEWLVLGANYSELLVKRIDVEVVDFYRGNP